jgi:outer membrane murein-binding lipoprotein Lpp
VPASNTGTTGAPSAKPKTLAAAVAAFDAAVIDGVKRGSIDRKSANDLRRRAGDITKNNAKRDSVSTQIDDLRARIDELERAGRITSAAEADDLRAAVDAIEATTNG